jgi:hypothetical protein
MIISQAPIMKNKVMISLLRLFNQNSIFGYYYFSLILECFDFLPYSLIHDIMKVIMMIFISKINTINTKFNHLKNDQRHWFQHW